MHYFLCKLPMRIVAWNCAVHTGAPSSVLGGLDVIEGRDSLKNSLNMTNRTI